MYSSLQKAILFLTISFLPLVSCEKEEYIPVANNSYVAPVDGIFQSPNGAGSLHVTNGVRVLKLHGTNQQMGYAHGYLLAKEILYVIDNFAFAYAEMWGLSYSELENKMGFLDWTTGHYEEMQGILQGIQAKLPSEERMVHPPAESTREISLMDLIILNSNADWGCSSFSIWGAGRNDSSVIHARNLDYHSGNDNCFQKSQIIISFDDGVHNRWAGVSICGFIGCISGMTEHGMTLALQDANHYSTSDATGFVSRCMILRKIAENAQSTWKPLDVANYMDGIKAYTGMNLHVTFPVQNRSNDEIAGIIEFDGYSNHTDGRACLRSPSKNPTVPVSSTHDQTTSVLNCLITTNHYLERKTHIIEESADRYILIRDELAQASSDGHVDVQEAVQIMKLVGHIGTIHTIVYEADTRIMRFYLAQAGLGGFDCPEVSYHFDDLF